jgi:hypothetical protein
MIVNIRGEQSYMPNFKFSKLKKPLLGAALLKTVPLLMGNGGSEEGYGKSQLGVNSLILEETPGRNATICMPKEAGTAETSESAPQWMSSDLIVAVDVFASSYIEIVFSVREMLAYKENHVLLLVYSQKLTPSPDISTPKSVNKLQLDINTLEVLGQYDIPAQRMLPQSNTRLGVAKPAPRSIVSFSVNLDTSVLPVMMEKRESIYLQAALLPRSDFEAGNFEVMILSEVDAISFVEMECPEDRQDFTESSDITATVITK